MTFPVRRFSYTARIYIYIYNIYLFQKSYNRSFCWKSVLIDFLFKHWHSANTQKKVHQAWLHNVRTIPAATYEANGYGSRMQMSNNAMRIYATNSANSAACCRLHSEKSEPIGVEKSHKAVYPRFYAGLRCNLSVSAAQALQIITPWQFLFQ